jgi:glycosyltransferase involved in cell wall biosynthesis
MRILVLCHEYPPIGGGGGRVAQDLCLGLAKRGHEITLLTANCQGMPAREIQNGVKIVRLNSGRKYPYKAGLFAMAGFVWAAFWNSLKIIRRNRPDVIHVHFAVPSGAAAWALKLFTGVPYVLTAHLGDVPGGVPEKTGRWFKFIFPFTPPIWRSAGAVAAVSDFTRDLALKSYPVEIKTILNGVDTTVLDPGIIKVNQPPRLVFAGRFVPQKNPVGLVNILSGIKNQPWNCTLIGDGLFRPEIEAAILRNGLQDRFNLTGWIPPEEVIRWFSKSDILFMPSLSEGLPVVGVQALSMGLALVLSRVGGCVDLVQEGINGALLEPSDEAGFGQSLRNLLGDPVALLAARRASRDLARKFDINIIVEQYEILLKGAAQKAARFHR